MTLNPLYVATRLTALFAAFVLALASPVVAQEAGSGPSISAAFPFEPEFIEVNGHRMAYVEEGAGPVVLFIHGNPTSSYLWRNIIPFVSDTHRAVAVDLIGMGASDKPDISYTFADHYAYVEGFIEARELRDVILVLHDWGGALGTYYAANHPENVRAVIMMEAVIPPAMPVASWDQFGDPQTIAIFQAFRDPEQRRQMLIEQNMFIEQLLPGLIVRPLSAVEMDAYRAPFVTPESRHPILVWPNELPIEGVPARNVDVMAQIAAWLAVSDQPKLFFYASPGALFPPEAADRVPENMNNVETRFIGAGIHYVQEDQPEVIGRNISDWLRDVVGAAG